MHCRKLGKIEPKKRHRFRKETLRFNFVKKTSNQNANVVILHSFILLPMITIIAAIGLKNELGKDNDLIWHLPADLKRFKKVTTGHTIIMGRKTFESIGKPLPNRKTVIITRDPNYKFDGCEVVHSIEKAIENNQNDEQLFIIGGAQIYKQVIEKDLADQLDITLVQDTFEADVYFPEIDMMKWKMIRREDLKSDEKNKFDYSFVTFQNVSESE